MIAQFAITSHAEKPEDDRSRAARLGHAVEVKVPDCDCIAFYHIDFLDGSVDDPGHLGISTFPREPVKRNRYRDDLPQGLAVLLPGQAPNHDRAL
jgi:hypothetical protein